MTKPGRAEQLLLSRTSMDDLKNMVYRITALNNRTSWKKTVAKNKIKTYLDTDLRAVRLANSTVLGERVQLCLVRWPFHL